MRKLWSVLVRVLLMLVLFLWSALLVSMVIDWWYRRSQPVPKPRNDMPPAANISAPVADSQPVNVDSFAVDEPESQQEQSFVVDESSPEPEASFTTYISGGRQWTRDEIVTLRETLDNPPMMKLMEMLRDRNGEPVNLNEIEAATGRSSGQTRADLSMLSRKSHLINDHTDWPLDSAMPTDGTSSRAYSIPRQYLEWWFEE